MSKNKISKIIIAYAYEKMTECQKVLKNKLSYFISIV